MLAHGREAPSLEQHQRRYWCLGTSSFQDVQGLTLEIFTCEERRQTWGLMDSNSSCGIVQANVK